MKTFTEDPFEFQEARIVGGDEGAGIGVMVGLKGHDGMREEGKAKLRGDERREITSVEEGLGEVSGVGVEIIWVTADAPPPDCQRVGNGAFGG